MQPVEPGYPQMKINRGNDGTKKRYPGKTMKGVENVEHAVISIPPLMFSDFNRFLYRDTLSDFQAALGLFGMVGGPLLGIFLLGILFPCANWQVWCCGDVFIIRT